MRTGQLQSTKWLLLFQCSVSHKPVITPLLTHTHKHAQRHTHTDTDLSRLKRDKQPDQEMRVKKKEETNKQGGVGDVWSVKDG